jgi:hypothetical protein
MRPSGDPPGKRWGDLPCPFIWNRLWRTPSPRRKSVFVRACMGVWQFIYPWSRQANPFLSTRSIVGFCRMLLKIRVFQDPGGAAEKDKPDSRPAVGACREAFTLEDGGRVTFAMEIMPDAVDPRFGDLFPGFEDPLGLRCALHLSLSPRNLKMDRPESGDSVQECAKKSKRYK